MVFRASTSSVTSLHSYLDPELLRGVPLHVCLSGWAQHWSQKEGAMFDVDERSYALGHQIESYDFFLSHDWATGRWLKLLSMMIIFNSRAAAVASLVTSIVVGALRMTEVIPDEMWTVIFGYAAFLLFLCFWQRIRLVIFKPLVVFVDKLCIAQHDDELKEKGILGLAGFVDHSKKLTILWSPRYFSRLWCTYEIAAFLRDQVTDEKPLQVMPVKMSVILFLLSVCWHILTICFYVLEYVTDDDTGMLDEILVGAFVAAFLMLTMPIVCYIGIGLMKDIQELPNQLKTFRVQESKCFCCSHNHVHPETGRRIICDRQLVFKTLKRWFGAEGNTLAHLTLPTCGRNPEQHLDAFNFLVQSDLAQTVLKSVGGDTLPFSYAVYMVSICNVPFLAQYMASWKAEHGAYTSLELAGWTLRKFMDWATLSLVMLCSLRFCMFLWRIGFQWSKTRSRILVSFLLVPLLNGLIAACWIPVQVTRVMTSEVSIWPLIPFTALVAITFKLYSSSFVWVEEATEVVTNMVRMVSETSSCEGSERIWKNSTTSRNHMSEESAGSQVYQFTAEIRDSLSTNQCSPKHRESRFSCSDDEVDAWTTGDTEMMKEMPNDSAHHAGLSSVTSVDFAGTQAPAKAPDASQPIWSVTVIDVAKLPAMKKSEGEMSRSNACNTWSTASIDIPGGLPEYWTDDDNPSSRKSSMDSIRFLPTPPSLSRPSSKVSAAAIERPSRPSSKVSAGASGNPERPPDRATLITTPPGSPTLCMC